MADNLTVAPGGGATKVLTDEVTYSGDTAHLQGVKLMVVTGAEGSRTADDVGTSAAPLAVDPGTIPVAAASDAIACDTFRVAALTNTAVAVKASPGTLYGYHIHNPAAGTTYIQFYDTAQGSVAVGTTTPKLTLGLPAGASVDIMSAVPGIGFGVAITIAATTTATGGTAPAGAAVANVIYK